MQHGLQKVINARVIYVDMNAFFASVEQQYNPALRNRPVAVVSHATARGTVLAVSYEAKAFGIQTGSKVENAQISCPNLILVEPHAERYRTVHNRFMAILEALFGPEVQARSIDEAVLFLPPNWQSSSFCWQLAQQIKTQFRQQLGPYIRCSIGIAPNLLLAKVATNLQKPDGLLEITKENTPHVLSQLTLTDLPGIASRSAALLAFHQISTPLMLYQTPSLQLYKEFGIWGKQWWWRLHGYEPDYNQSRSKSISHEHVLKNYLSEQAQVLPIIIRMTDRLIHRLQTNQWRCKQISLQLSLLNAPSFYRERRLDSASSNYFLLLKSVLALTDQLPLHPAGPIRKVSIGFTHLQEEMDGWQLDLFQIEDKYEAVSRSIASIRKRYGFGAIQVGSIIALDQRVAREQLGFGRIKDRKRQ